jgi:hypothetical protein
LCRGDDEDGPALGEGNHERCEEAQGRRRIKGGRGMDFMDAIEREALAGKELVEGGKPEGKKSACPGFERGGRYQPTQILELCEAGAPRFGKRKTGRRGKKHEKVYRTEKEQKQYDMTLGQSSS